MNEESNILSDDEFDEYCRILLSQESFSFVEGHWLHLCHLLDTISIQKVSWPTDTIQTH